MPKLTDQNGVKTPALPATGTGIAGFGLQQCAEIMLDEVHKHVAAGTKLTDVYFVLFDAAAYNAFRQVHERQKGTR